MSKYPTLFSRSDDWQNNALLNFGGDRWYGFVVGYRRAADILVEQVMATGQDQDTLVYPIAYLYRHHLELALKEIIKQGNKLLDKQNKAHNHYLDKGWEEAKSVIRLLQPQADDPDEFALVDHFVGELAAIDRKSTAFRYPFDLDDSNQLAGQDDINLRHLKECMDSFLDFLENITWWLAAMEDESQQAACDRYDWS